MKVIKKILVILLVLALVVGAGVAVYGYINGDGTVYNYVEDTSVYGRTTSNSMNSNGITISEAGDMYMGFTSRVLSEIGRGTYFLNLTTGEYKDLGARELKDLNAIGNTVYALERTQCEGYAEVRIVTFTWDDMSLQTVREGYATDLLWADGMLYFNTDSDFRSLNLETGEEYVIYENILLQYFMDNDRIYFKEDGESSICSMTISGEEVTTLIDEGVREMFMYEGRIYFGHKGITDTLKSMNPDGTDVRVEMYFNAHIVGEYNGTIIYSEIGSGRDAVYGYVDLKKEKLVMTDIETVDKVEELLLEVYKEEMNLQKEQFPDLEYTDILATDPSTNEAYVQNGYFVFTMDGVINQLDVYETFIYDIESGEITMVNQYFK